MQAQVAQEAHRPRLLFVDDEQRVLNSMRIMFRRQFDLFLASHGAEALDIVRDKDIDVIVADHRMPKMTGVEVLSKVRAMSPRTVRILLDGLRGPRRGRRLDQRQRGLPFPHEAVRAAAAARDDRARGEAGARDACAAGAGAADRIRRRHDRDHPRERYRDRGDAGLATGRANTSSTAVLEQPKFAPRPRRERRVRPRPKLATGLGIVVFSMDHEVIDIVQKAVRGRLPVYTAGNIVQVVKYLTEQRPGVLVTDVSEDKATIQSMTARLKEHLPQLVTIAVSQHRDVLDMVWLINHGQIFRFLRKPLSAGRTAISLQAALQHHRLLLKNPELAKRHEVDASDQRLRRHGRRARQAEGTQTSLGKLMSAAKPTARIRADLLLWIAGGAIAAVGTAWLVITQPWKRRRRTSRSSTLRAPIVLRRRRRRLLTAEAEAVADDAAARPEATLDNPLRMARARVRGRHADRARRVQRVDVVLARPEGRAGQRGGPRRPDEGRGRPRAPRRDGARSRPLRRRARDRRAHSRCPARPRGRQGAGAEDLARRPLPGNARRARALPLPEPEVPRVARVETRAAPTRRRNRRSTRSSRRARRSRRRWPKAGC